MTATRPQMTLFKPPPRRRFCPARDCKMPPCGPGTCLCRPCSCNACVGRRIVVALATPDLVLNFSPSINAVQPRLFAVQPQGGGLVPPQQIRKYRQGDILVVESTKIPAQLTPVPLEGGRLILAHGEVTGHAHVIEGMAALFTPSDAADLEERFLRIEGEAELVHDEHGTIALPPGDYRVLRQREYTPEANLTVAD